MEQKNWIFKNGGIILDVLAIIGVVATAIISSKASKKAEKRKKECEEIKGEPLNKKEEILSQVPSYIPTATVAGATIACIIGAEFIEKKHQASLAATCLILKKAYDKYKKKAIDLYSDDIDLIIQSSIAEEKAKNRSKDLIPSSNDQLLWYEPYSDECFYATEKDVISAICFVNKRFQQKGMVSLNYYRDLLGMESKDGFDELGWDQDNVGASIEYFWIDFDYDLSKTETDENGEECIPIRYLTEPDLLDLYADFNLIDGSY